MGRPSLIPTDTQREQVKSFAAFGTSQEEIARRLGIRSLKTLPKHYCKELDDGPMEANYKVGKSLYDMAISGRHPGAAMYWLTNRAGWRPISGFEFRAGPPPPFIVAKDDGGNRS
jgi:hypothetical protein